MEKNVLYKKISKIIQKPYFRDLVDMGVVDKKSQEKILSILFGEPVYIGSLWDEVLTIKDDSPIYYETEDGYWEIYGWENGNLTYKEYPNGDYLKKVYDNDDNLLEHVELDDGKLNTYRYDLNGNQIYYESNGYWIVSEFNSNNKLVYREKSDGEIYDIRLKKNITESTEDKNSYYKKIIPLLKKPYMVDFINFNIPRKDWEGIFRLIYGWRISIQTSEPSFFGSVKDIPDFIRIVKEIPFTNKKVMVYYEDGDGDWVEKEFDENGNQIGFEDASGKKNITESVDRKEKFYDYIIKTMLDDTDYEIIEKNYGGTFSEQIASVKFPMYPWGEYTYKPWDVHRWRSGWMMGAADIDYVVNNFGVDEELAEIIFNKYINELSLEITEKMDIYTQYKKS